MLAALEIPQLNGIVITATCQRLPIGTHFERLDCPLMSLSTLRHSLLCVSHQRSMPSLPPLSSSPPAGLQASAYTIEPGSLQDRRRSPLGTSQTTTSPPPLLPPLPAILVPPGLHATLLPTPPYPP